MTTSLDNFTPKRLYFVGGGGIGMANLVRYYLSKGMPVSAYDLTESDLTRALTAEGCEFTYSDSEENIPLPYRDPEETLVVYTPAVKEDNRILSFFRRAGHRVVKRAALLGLISRQGESICVAGSHGKTTTSSMVANILDLSPIKCSAFLGGILRNTGSNLIINHSSPYIVAEADEYDRSFHQLRPKIAVVTSTDPDHLDIYGDEDGYLEGFAHFTELIESGGTLIMHTGLKLKPRVGKEVKVVTYSTHDKEADWHADSIRYLPGRLLFDIVTPEGRIADVELGVPVEINIDNAVAAAAACRMAGATDDDIRRGLKEFLGAKRRFEIRLRPEDNKAGIALIDDYAHSPAEVEASIHSVRKLYPGRHLTVIFQPHLYTRTRDFAPEFAKSLSAADRVWLPEIYPAREKPIPGVTSELILNDIECADKRVCKRADLAEQIKMTNFEILMTLGAADIDRLLPEFERIIKEKEA